MSFMETGVMPNGVYCLENAYTKTCKFMRVTDEGEFPCEPPEGWEPREGWRYDPNTK